jgi:hypothetical protein
MLKKTILATLIGTTALASTASFAGDWNGGGRHGYGHRPVVVERMYHPAPRPGAVQRVVVQRYYQPRPVLVERRVVVQRPAPAPVYVHSVDPGAGLAILAGAVIGGAIAYNIAR